MRVPNYNGDLKGTLIQGTAQRGLRCIAGLSLVSWRWLRDCDHGMQGFGLDFAWRVYVLDEAMDERVS